MLLLVDEVKKRTQYLNTYIDHLSSSIAKHKYKEALKFISNQRSSINHTHVSKYNPNTFLIDSLKTKNQKLHTMKKQLQQQKQQVQAQIQQATRNCGSLNNTLNQEKVSTVISRIQLTLKDVKKVDLQPMILQSNYQQLTITTPQTKDIFIHHTSIFNIQKKSLYMSINAYWQDKQTSIILYIIFKFNSQLSLTKWYNAFVFGKMLQQAKSSRYLFLETNRKKDDVEHMGVSKRMFLAEQSQVVTYGNTITGQSTPTGFRGTFVPQKSKQMAQTTFAKEKQSVIPENPFYQYNKHQATTSLWVNDSISIKKPTNYSTHRPTPLNRIRGKSMYLQIQKGKNYSHFRRQPFQEEQRNDFFEDNQQKSSINSKNSFRKASEDITLRPKKSSTHQDRKLQKFRSQRNLADEILLNSNAKKKTGSNSGNNNNNFNNNNNWASGYSRRIDAQIAKKNQLLQKTNINFTKSLMRARPQVQSSKTWFKQQQKQSQTIRSQSSRSRQKKGNILSYRFREEQQYRVDDPIRESINSQLSPKEILEASQSNQISPTFPKKIIYQHSSHIRLHPVQQTMGEMANQFRQSVVNVNVKSQSAQSYNKQGKIQTLQEMEEYELEESPQGFRIDRLNTLDSDTDKEDSPNNNEVNQSNSEDHQEEEFQQLLQELKKGLILTKCAQGSFWTREKEIKLSENQNTLLIIDVKEKKIKKIPVSDIISIEYAKFSKGIIKHIPQIEEKKCFMFTVKQGKEIKKVEFVGNNPEKLAEFSNSLAYFVEMFKAS